MNAFTPDIPDSKRYSGMSLLAMCLVFTGCFGEGFYSVGGGHIDAHGRHQFVLGVIAGVCSRAVSAALSGYEFCFN